MKDHSGFKASAAEIDRDRYVIATYALQTAHKPIDAVLSLCRYQSTAIWRRFGKEEDLRERFGAKLIHLVETGSHESCDLFGLPAEKLPSNEGCTSAEVSIAYPIENIGQNIPQLLTTLLGEAAFDIALFTTIRLIDLHFPPDYLASFTGPRYGVDGVREQLNIRDRPLFCGVIKPNLGLSPAGYAELAYEGLKGGLDIVKDDELLTDPPYAPLAKRVERITAAVKRVEEEEGVPKLYIANITDCLTRLLSHYEQVVVNGGKAAMVSLGSVGWSVLPHIARNGELIVVSHSTALTPLLRPPRYGLRPAVAATLQRMLGADIVILPGLSERVGLASGDVLDAIEAYLCPLSGLAPVLPGLGGGESAATVGTYFEALDQKDFLLVVGHGVYGHPMGPRAGAESLQQAWETLSAGLTIDEGAEQKPALREAVRFFESKEKG